MTASRTQSDAYCSDLVRGGDEDRWLASQYAAPPLRPALMTLCAFQIELRRIPSAVSEPPLGEIRLQWWREALDEIRDGKTPRAHPVVEALAESGLAAPVYAPDIEAILDAAARPLYGEGFSSLASLESWLKAAEGGFDALAAKLAGGDAALARAAAGAGTAFALAREGGGVAPNLAAEAHARAKALYKDTAPALSDAPPEASPALLHLSLTPSYLVCGGKAFPARKRLRLFAAMAFAHY
ncbi:squalene/phytoene synthase family protein [Hyphococcus luteus]|nr:squalene/phytoene synthase family protein [Marinicaulis flavus]